MNDWASRRKTLYLIALALILAGASFALFWKYWYQEPTCFNNLKDGNETGIDCGGSCTKVCSNEAIAPIVKWDSRLFETLSGVWSVLVYVENPNPNTDASYVPYTFTIYDANSGILAERKGATILPRGKTVGIFEGSITIGNGKVPKRAVFEIGKNILWKKSENKNDDITVTHGPLLRMESEPRVEANVKNNNINEVKNIELVITIFDGSDNAIAASRTFIENIKKGENTDVFFTWPKPFELGSKICEKNSNVMLLLDRSGSMASSGSNPVQPLSDAKSAAQSFIDQLKTNDKVGVISFASDSKEPTELNLSSDLNLAKKAVESVTIESGNIQYTNIYSALHVAWQELISVRTENTSKKVAILLTDGVANNPKNPNGKTEEDDIKYAEDLALKEATNAKKEGIILYAIGLGNKVNESFLRAVASEEKNYFFSPASSDLESIYESISSDICKEVPARIEITYKIFGDSI